NAASCKRRRSLSRVSHCAIKVAESLRRQHLRAGQTLRRGAFVSRFRRSVFARNHVRYRHAATGVRSYCSGQVEEVNRKWYKNDCKYMPINRLLAFHHTTLASVLNGARRRSPTKTSLSPLVSIKVSVPADCTFAPRSSEIPAMQRISLVLLLV